MSLTLHYHPLSSFCWKALIGLYELEIPFEKNLVEFQDADQRAAFAKLWPIAKFPVLEDRARGRVVPESTIVLEYLDGLTKGPRRLIPADPERALECRLRDRLFDLYVHVPMQKMVVDRLRPEGQRDALGVEQARSHIETSYALLETMIGAGPWAVGAEFSMADCASMPALYYANKNVPMNDRFPNLAAYLARLEARPSIARVLREAEPYFHLVPK